MVEVAIPVTLFFPGIPAWLYIKIQIEH